MSDLIKKEFLKPQNVKDGTPANAITRFMYGWKVRKSEIMLEVCQKSWLDKPNAKAKIEMWFKNAICKGMKIIAMRRISDICYEAKMTVGIQHRYDIKTYVVPVKCFVVCEKKAHEPSINGSWGVNPVSLLKDLNIIGKIFVDSKDDLGLNLHQENVNDKN